MKKNNKPKQLPSAQDLRIAGETEKTILLTWTSTQKRYWAVVVRDGHTICHCFTGTSQEAFDFCREHMYCEPLAEKIKAVSYAIVGSIKDGNGKSVSTVDDALELLKDDIVQVHKERFERKAEAGGY